LDGVATTQSFSDKALLLFLPATSKQRGYLDISGLEQQYDALNQRVSPGIRVSIRAISISSVMLPEKRQSAYHEKIGGGNPIQTPSPPSLRLYMQSRVWLNLGRLSGLKGLAARLGSS